MAWHDRGWDGKVCRDPTANTYCTGTHSLLSERLAREKRLDAELAAPGANLDASLPEYLPPCFWSSCAFSEGPTATLHRHPFGYLRDKKQIQAKLRPYSVYTWPFRLSITHNSFKRHGQYFPDLEKRIDRYCARLVKGKSLIFFYLNYDNPVSADDYKYALVGCGQLSHDPELTGDFPFDKAELQEIRSGEGMKNFPSLNRAIQLTHQGAETSVRLPYHEYLDYIADHPEAESQLDEIKVLIEEPALLPGFKYVSEQVNDDHALLDHLGQMGERAIVLAPTGKAALRLGGSANGGAEWKAETIDHWIFRSGLGNYLGGHVSLNTLSRSDRFLPTDNVVLDEMSMMDLGHLALLFRALEVHQPGSIKRVILVGDENQLPPIGCGRPFYDIVSYLREDAAREKRNMVRLTTNCRQQHDPVVLDAAYLFAGKNRYHTDLYDRMLAGGNISPFLDVQYWETPEQLQNLVADSIDSVLEEVVPERDKLSAEQAFNLLMRLYANGFVPNNDTESLALDRVQLLTPYRGGASGSLGLSDFTRRRYRQEAWPDRTYKDTALAHSDKVIRITNWYGWNTAEKRKELRLSNGSVGVLCNNRKGRKAYFPESEWPVDWKRMKEDDFELAYSITVHKAQGSEFQEVVVVLPERRALLSRELVYTALTRSKTKLTLLIQKTPRLNPLQVARDRSVLLGRNSSIFANGCDRFWRVLHLAGFTARRLEPEEARLLLDCGCGITSAVARPTVSATDLRRADYIAAHPVFERKIANYRPRYLAFPGKPACSVFLNQRDLSWGLQPTTFGGSAVWVLPNPSGLNRAFTLGKLTDAYRELFDAVDLRSR